MVAFFIIVLCALTLVEIINFIVVKMVVLILLFVISALVIYSTRPAPPPAKPAPASGHGGHGGGGAKASAPKKPPVVRWLFVGVACVCLYFFIGWWLSWRSAKLYAERGAEQGHTMAPIVYFADENFGMEWTWRVLGFDRHTCHQELRILKCSPIGDCRLWEHPIDLGVDPNWRPCVPTHAPYPKY